MKTYSGDRLGPKYDSQMDLPEDRDELKQLRINVVMELGKIKAILSDAYSRKEVRHVDQKWLIRTLSAKKHLSILCQRIDDKFSQLQQIKKEQNIKKANNEDRRFRRAAWIILGEEKFNQILRFSEDLDSDE